MGTSIKRLMFTVGAVLAMALVVPGTATAAPSDVAVPEGGVVTGKWISFQDGAVQASIEPMAYSDCPAGWLCLWEHSSYGGRMLRFQSVTSGWQNLTDYGFNDEMSSWRNRHSRNAQWAYHTWGEGTRRCMRSGSSASSLGGDNDEASSIRINLC